MTYKKRIFALSAAVVILMSCFMVAIVPASATVDFFYSHYVFSANPGNVPYPYTSWPDLLSYYYELSEGTCYFFELRNTEQGGNRYVPFQLVWDLPYSADQSGFGLVNLIYRFYLPYYPSSPGWDFQIRTDTGFIIFNSASSMFYRSDIYENVGYYEFELDRDAIGFSNGWYITSDYEPQRPIGGNIRTYNVQFQYYNSTGQYLGFRDVIKEASTSLVEVDVPSIPDYIISSVSGPGYYSGGKFILNSLQSDVVLRVDVYSIQEAVDDAYQRGYDRGKTEGRAEGIIQGYHDYKNTQQYADALEDSYLKGYQAAVDDGAENQLITNPLLFVTEPVVAFLEIEPYPGLPLGVIFLASVAVCLLVVFLKIFSGG